jgi:hypothetical protein
VDCFCAPLCVAVITPPAICTVYGWLWYRYGIYGGVGRRNPISILHKISEMFQLLHAHGPCGMTPARAEHLCAIWSRDMEECWLVGLLEARLYGRLPEDGENQDQDQAQMKHRLTIKCGCRLSDIPYLISDVLPVPPLEICQQHQEYQPAKTVGRLSRLQLCLSVRVSGIRVLAYEMIQMALITNPPSEVLHNRYSNGCSQLSLMIFG